MKTEFSIVALVVWHLLIIGRHVVAQTPDLATWMLGSACMEELQVCVQMHLYSCKQESCQSSSTHKVAPPLLHELFER